MDAKTFKPLFKGLLFLALLALAVGLAKWSGLDHALDSGWVDAEIRGRGLHGAALFLAAGVLFTAVGLPRQIVAFLGGYAFGVATGAVLANVAMGLSCALTVYGARFLGRDFVYQRFGRRFKRIDGFLCSAPLTMAVAIRFFPVGHNLATNLAAGVSSVHAPTFILGSFLGYIPLTLVFALFGSGLDAGSWVQMAVSLALFAVASLMGVRLYQRYKAQTGQPLDDEENGEGDQAEKK